MSIDITQPIQPQIDLIINNNIRKITMDEINEIHKEYMNVNIQKQNMLDNLKKYNDDMDTIFQMYEPDQNMLLHIKKFNSDMTDAINALHMNEQLLLDLIN